MASGGGACDAARDGSVLRLVRSTVGSGAESVHGSHRLCQPRPDPLARAAATPRWQQWEPRLRFGLWLALYLISIALAALLIAFIITTPALAHGQTSQPASAPVPAAWWVANWPSIAAVLGYLLANLATMLSEFPEAKDATTRTAKAVRVIRLLAALVSVVHFKNTGGLGVSIKLPGQPVTNQHLNPPN